MDNVQGGGPGVNALIRRGIHPGILQQQAPMQTQVSPGSANFDPNMQTPPSPAMPDQSPTADMAQFAQSAQQPPQPQPQQPMPQQAAPQETGKPKTLADKIVDALIKHLQALPQPQDPAAAAGQPMPQPQPAPGQGPMM